MIVDFFRHGTGQSSPAINYLLGKNQDREAARLLSGDISEVAELIDSSPFLKKYTSGCLSFFEDDLNEQSKKEIMEQFEKTLFPGMSSDQYRVLWVEHRDKENKETGEKRLELNFLIPNIEITTGKRLQPFYVKSDLDRVDSFKSKINYEYNLYDPDDPLHIQSIKVAKDLPKDKKQFVRALNNEIQIAVGHGQIYNRSSLVNFLNDIGLEITRTTKSQISIADPMGGKKPIRLTGEYYAESFGNIEQREAAKRAASERYSRESEERYRRCSNRHKELCEIKRDFLSKRYGRGDSRDSQIDILDSRQLSKSLGKEDSGSRFELQSVRVISSKSSRDGEDKTTSFQNNFSLSFSDVFNAYLNSPTWYRAKSKERKHREDEHTSGESNSHGSFYKSEDMPVQITVPTVCASEHKHSTFQQRLPHSNGTLIANEIRARIIEDHRRAAEAIAAATAVAARELAAHAAAIRNHRELEEINNRIRQEAESSRGSHSKLSDFDFSAITARYADTLYEAVQRQLREALDTRRVEYSTTNPRVANDSSESYGQRQNYAGDQANDRRNDASVCGIAEFKSLNISKTVEIQIVGTLEQAVMKIKQIEQNKSKKIDKTRYEPPTPF